MKTVVVFPERCIGCMHCMFQCAMSHLKHADLTAISGEFLPKPRIRVYPARQNYAFPSKCRHCDPAPCLEACPSAAIVRKNGVVLVEVDRCINCGMCAMVCPFGVIRFYVDWGRADKRPSSYKCDGCIERVAEGKPPACVEACKTGALRFGEVNELIAEKEERVASTYSPLFERREVVPENLTAWLKLEEGLRW